MNKKFQNNNPFGPDPRLIRNKGYVYIIKNDEYKKKLLKIGATTRTPDERVKDLNKKRYEGIPGKFYLVDSFKTRDCGNAELDVHQELDKYRIEKEWFNAPLEVAKSSIAKHCSRYNEKYKKQKRKLKKTLFEFDVEELRRRIDKLNKKKKELKGKSAEEKFELEELERKFRKLQKAVKKAQEQKREQQIWLGILIGIALGIVCFVLYIIWKFWFPLLVLFVLGLLYYAWKFVNNDLLIEDFDDDDDDINDREKIEIPTL